MPRQCLLTIDLDSAEKDKTFYARIHRAACKVKGYIDIGGAKRRQRIARLVIHHMHPSRQMNNA